MKTRKILISVFVLGNLFTVLWANRPGPLIEASHAYLDQWPHSQWAYRMKYMGWLIQRYAHLTGLDNRWQMFGHQPRFNWWYIIKAKYKAKYKEGDLMELPLPLQSDRSFIQHMFFDFKETKFHLNLYQREHAREAYARYLCRQYPTHENRPIESITYELHWQHLYPREKASETGNHLDPIINIDPINEFICPKEEVKT